MIVLQFANKNQDLMEECLMLKETLKQHEQASEDEGQKLQRRFVQEMSVCFSELQSLVEICVQQAEGREPNISLLLGTRGTFFS
jgi:centrosomal protein CEP85